MGRYGSACWVWLVWCQAGAGWPARYCVMCLPFGLFLLLFYCFGAVVYVARLRVFLPWSVVGLAGHAGHSPRLLCMGVVAPVLVSRCFLILRVFVLYRVPVLFPVPLLWGR